MDINKNMKFVLTALTILLMSKVVFGQKKDIKIRYIGNCGLHITDGVNHIYSDFPYKSGAHHYAEYHPSEIDSLKENAYYIFTHKHSDHYYKGKVKKILKAKNGKKYGKWNISALEHLSNTIPGFKIQAFKTKHMFSFAHYSYLITWHGKKIFLSGDTEHAETILSIKGIDWAFIPAWLIREINASETPLNAKHVGIYHIGPRDKINIEGEKVLMLNTQGEVITIPNLKQKHLQCVNIYLKKDQQRHDISVGLYTNINYLIHFYQTYSTIIS